MDLDGSEFVPDLDPPELQEPAMNDEYVKVDKEHGAGDGSSSPEVISGPEGEEGEALPSTTDAMANVGVPLIEEPVSTMESEGRDRCGRRCLTAIGVDTVPYLQEDEDTVPTIEPPPVPEITSIADPPAYEAEPPFIPPEEPPEDFTLPELPPSKPGMTGGGVEDVVMERQTVKPFITSHTESFPSSSSQ